MDDPTSLLFGLDGFRLVDVVRVDDRVVQVVIETQEMSWACPDCGAGSSWIKDRPMVQVKDLAEVARGVWGGLAHRAHRAAHRRAVATGTAADAGVGHR